MSVSAWAWAAAGGYVTPTVSLSTANVSHNTDSITYANVGYYSTGVEYQNAAGLNNFTTSRGNWKDSGDAEGAWIDHTLNSGSALYTRAQVPGTRAQMNANRLYRQRDTNSSAGGVTSNITVTMYDAQTGGSSLGSATFSLTATYFNACPLCCFTPDTMITMAWGGVVPIKDVKVGDEIVVYNPDKGGVFETEVVEEIITRTRRAMFRVEFEDGTYLHMSDDHPLHIPEKGPSAIAPTPIYKDLEDVHVLRVGDFVTHINGDWNASAPVITKIEYDEYFGTVYTLGNKLFIANGKVAY